MKLQLDDEVECQSESRRMDRNIVVYGYIYPTIEMELTRPSYNKSSRRGKLDIHCESH